jgi:hypothetical protein
MVRRGVSVTHVTCSVGHHSCEGVGDPILPFLGRRSPRRRQAHAGFGNGTDLRVDG